MNTVEKKVVDQSDYLEYVLTRRARMQIKIRRLQKKKVPLLWILVTALFLLVLTILLGKITPMNKTHAPERKDSTVLCMDFSGDIMLGRNIKIIGEKKGYDVFFDGVRDYWNQADLVFTNFENAVLKKDPSEYSEAQKKIHLYADYDGLNSLLKAGVNVIGFANNHAYDYSEKSITELIEYLNSNHIKFSGIGNNLDEAVQCSICEVNGIKVAFLAITDVFYREARARSKKAGVLTTAYTKYNQIIQDVSKLSDIQVVYVHFGEENATCADDTQTKIAHKMIDAGADFVIGSHPHVVEKMELYKGGVVFYSMGNFIFDQGNTFTRDTVLVQFTLDMDGKGMLEVVPMRINNGIPMETKNLFYKQRIKRELVQDLENTSYTIDENGHIFIQCGNIDLEDTVNKREARAKAEAEAKALAEEQERLKKEAEAKALEEEKLMQETGLQLENELENPVVEETEMINEF